VLEAEVKSSKDHYIIGNLGGVRPLTGGLRLKIKKELHVSKNSIPTVIIIFTFE
jgi:hypothetical protein